MVAKQWTPTPHLTKPATDVIIHPCFLDPVIPDSWLIIGIHGSVSESAFEFNIGITLGSQSGEPGLDARDGNRVSHERSID